MRILIQKVATASVTVDNTIVGQIGKGLLLFVGFHRQDTAQSLPVMVKKVLNLRIFPDASGKMNLSLLDVGGQLLVISQFTLYANTASGRRPDFLQAAHPSHAQPLFDQLVNLFRTQVYTQTGQFGAHMNVSLVNEGPATFLLED